jgi:hypothetical protein
MLISRSMETEANPSIDVVLRHEHQFVVSHAYVFVPSRATLKTAIFAIERMPKKHGHQFVVSHAYVLVPSRANHKTAILAIESMLKRYEHYAVVSHARVFSYYQA